MIKIDQLTFTYPGATSPSLKNINLEVERGDFLAIIGNNGCGKSTLCKLMNGLIPHFIKGDMEGLVMIDGLDTTQIDIGTLACKVGYVYQDFENQIIRPTVLDDASFACLNYGDKKYIEKGKKAITLCGLQEKMGDYVWQLSGGQKHLLALAGATALTPKIMILDEPIAQLDPAHAKKIYEVLKDLNENHGKTIIVIEHHTEFIADYCKNVLLMKDGEIKWKQTASEALRQVQELQDSNIFPPQVTIAAKQMIEDKKLDSSSVLPTTLEQGKKVFQELIYLGKKREERQVQMAKIEPLISFEKVGVAYSAVKGKKIEIMRDFSLDIYKGEKIALIGSNGAGKSTLMKLMIACLKPSAGRIIIKGRDIKNISLEKLSKEVSLVYQNPEEMFIKDSISGDIEYAMKVRDIKDYRARTKELLQQFNLEEIAERDGRLLSGGQMRRASLAIGIALNPAVLLLDEPTANLDIATRREIMQTLMDLKDITETVMIATHDMQLVCDWADRIIVLNQGQIVEDGERNKVFNNSIVMEKVGIRPPDIYRMGQLISSKAQCYTVQEFCQDFGRREAL